MLFILQMSLCCPFYRGFRVIDVLLVRVCFAFVHTVCFTLRFVVCFKLVCVLFALLLFL